MSDRAKKRTAQFIKSAGSYAEAITIPIPFAGQYKNVFGRKLDISSNTGLSLLLGKAVSGLRCAAMLSSKQLKSELGLLANFSRLHVPLTLLVPEGGHMYLPQLIQAGCIVFNAYSSQEQGDLLTAAQVISEKCLCPVVILADQVVEEEEAEPLASKDLLQWFGNPDDRVASPTNAQEMVLGFERRRMPVWLHMDQASLVGAKKEPSIMALEKAAQFCYDQQHYHAIIAATLRDFEELSGRSLSSYQQIGHEKAKHLIISTGLECQLLKDTSFAKILKKKKAKLIGLRQLFPIPQFTAVQERSLEQIAVLESIADSAQQGHYYTTFLQANHGLNPSLENGWYTDTPARSSIEAALSHLELSTEKSPVYFLDIPLINSGSQFPKHEVLLQQIKRHYPEITRWQVKSISPEKQAHTPSSDIPEAIRRYANQGAPYARISRFYDSTFFLYENAISELVADPFQAYPIVPIATASFTKRKGSRDMLPVFNPQSCTSIDDLLLSCDYGAMPSALITVESLLKHAEAEARKEGANISQLTPLIKKWVSSANRYIIKHHKEIIKASDFLLPAFEELLAKGDWDENKVKLLKKESQLLIDCVGELQVVIDELLFIDQERQKRGTGELFTVAVDPMACTGCGECAKLGDMTCMQLKPADDAIEQIKKVYKRFAQLPKTPYHSLQKLIEREEFDSFTALLLNKDLYRSFTPSSNQYHRQDQTLIRYYLALQEYSMRPAVQAGIKLLEKTRDTLQEGIKALLSNSLPVNKLDELMDVLSKHGEKTLQMKQVFDEWGEATKFSPVEKAKLERKLQLLEETKELRVLLNEGISGLGRPSCSLVVDQRLAALAPYPSNPFTVPALVSEGADTASLALGVCTGQLRHMLDQVRVQRRATLEASDQYQPARHDKELAALKWADLTEEERNIAPPVIVLATKEWFAEARPQSLNALLLNPYPVKVLVVDHGLVPIDRLKSEIQSTANSMWSLIAQAKTFLAQASMDDRNYLYEQLKYSLSFRGNALIHVLAPRVSGFDIAPVFGHQLSSLARSSRAFLQWSFQPDTASSSIASKISTAIEDINRDYQLVQLDYVEDEKNSQLSYPLSWADWAYLQHHLKTYFSPLKDNEQAVFVPDFLALSPKERSGKLPAIARVDDSGQLNYYTLSPELLEGCELSVAKLRTLREWAGLYTDFPEKLREKVAEELREEYESQKTAFEENLIEQKEKWEANYLAEIKHKIKNKLLDMSGM